MDNRGGGRTPRGKKGRGRGRGSPSQSQPQTQQDSPSSRSPSTASAAQIQLQSTSTPVTTTTPTRDDQGKVTATATQKEGAMSTPTPPQPQMEKEPEAPASTPVEPEPESKVQPSGSGSDDVKVDVEESEKIEEPASTSSTPLEEPVLPPPGSKEEAPSPEAETFAKGTKPRVQAKTLVVERSPEKEQSTDAPLTVDIEIEESSGATTTRGGGGGGGIGQQGHSRSGSVSPAYPYALIAPVGKPGYIGGVGISPEEVDSGSGGKSRPPGMIRRESAIAAVETAVKGFTKRQWILLIMFGLIDLLSAITISLQAPFYPAEAEKKGANATEYGFVFGIFEFMVFLTSPIFGKYMHKLGPRTVFSVGILVTSVAVISFGLLDRIEDHTTFIALCLVCRMFEALGCAGFFTATFTIIACEFPASVSTTFASLETFFGLGLIVGPTVGGALFGVGGFPLPFFVVGTLLLLAGLASSFVMPKIDRATDEENKAQQEKGYGILTIIKIPTVALAAVSIASTSMSLGFVSATMEPHIRRFNLTPFQTGLVFIVNGGVYALSAPIFGYICDNINRPIFVTIVGNVFIFISFLLVGPASFMPFDTILWVSIIGLVIQGLGFGCCLVSGFIVGLQDSIKHGLPDEIGTYAIASGLWTSMISLGAWVGPVLAGILFDNFGFRQASLLVLATSAVVGVTIFIHTCCDSFHPRKSDSETQPLLRPLSPLLGKKDIEEPKPSTSYGSTTGNESESAGGPV